MTGPDPARRPDGAAPQRAASSGRPRRRWPWLVLVALALLLVVRGAVVETFVVPSASMEPTLHAGDRIVVWRPGADEIARGDVVVFDGSAAFAGQEPPSGPSGVVARIGDVLGVRPGETLYVKRVVALGGQRVAMDVAGRLWVDGRPVSEPYADLGGTHMPFSVEVPPGRLWVLGDRRADSEDSRAHLGDPGGGSVPVEAVVGHVVGRYWPLDRLGGLRSPTSAPSDPAAPTTDTHEVRYP